MTPPVVFGLTIEGLSLDELSKYFETTAGVWCVTANPEILLYARRDARYAQALRQADVRLVDGFGVWACLRACGQRVTRVTGGQLATFLLERADHAGWRVAFLGGASGSAEQAAQVMGARYPRIQFWSDAGGYVGLDGTEDAQLAAARRRLQAFDPHILLVALGHPKQERWIAQHRHEFPRLVALAGIGGVFDVWAGRLKPAPSWLRQSGLEWAWRGWHEPRRLRRIMRAVIIFPIAFCRARWFGMDKA